MNYYKILQINVNATKEEVRKSYRRLSLIYHPDKNNLSLENSDMFNKITLAYQTLSNDENRKKYDKSILNEDVDINLEKNDCKTLYNEKISDILISLEVDLHHSYIGYSVPVEIKRTIYENYIKKEEDETIYVNIMRGIDNNEMIIIKEKGNISENGIKSDVKIKIILINNTEFIRCGLDLIYNKNLLLREALCGFKFKINYLDNTILTINNAEGNIIENNYKKILTNYGMVRDHIVGNLIINFNIIFPSSISSDNIKKLKDIL